jgi:anti-sigma B factor antagonist
VKELRIATRELDGGSVTVLDLDGYLDKRTTGDLERVVVQLSERGHLRLIVNCEKLQYLSSDGMGVFLSQLIKIRKNGGDIKFCCMREEARSVLSVLGLSKLLSVKDTERDALADFKKAEKGERERAAEPEKLRIDREDRENNVTVLVLQGFIDRHTIEGLDKTLRGLLDQGRARIVVDCAELSYISSNGMGVFISYVNKARNMGGDIRFCNMRDIARTVITMLGLHRLFEVYEDRGAAIESFGA